MARITRTLSVLALAALLAAPVLAANTTTGPGRGPGHGAGMGPGAGMGAGMGCPGMMAASIPPEKQAAFDALLEAHHAEAAPLHDALWAKHEELRALAANPNTKPETIQALVKELTDLRAQLRVKGDAFRAKVKSELGVTLPAGMGHGWGMGGCGKMGGRGMGHGYGMGGCCN